MREEKEADREFVNWGNRCRVQGEIKLEKMKRERLVTSHTFLKRVLQSSWAVLLGVPVAVHGLSYFTIASVCAVLLVYASKVGQVFLYFVRPFNHFHSRCKGVPKC